jgi:hypothetical protein
MARGNAEFFSAAQEKFGPPVTATFASRAADKGVQRRPHSTDRSSQGLWPPVTGTG